jgi:RNA methyltransferase, TrmH family
MKRTITSAQNALIKNVLLLTEKPRARKEQNRIVIEGVREIRLAFTNGFQITDLFYVPEMASPEGLALLDSFVAPVNLIEVTGDVFNRMAYRNDTGGMIALAAPKRYTFNDILLTKNPLLLVLETVEKPGNLGALLRTADAANLDAVVICDPQTDIFNPNAIRSGIGCVFTMPVITTTTEEAIAKMRSRGIRIFATALTATRYYHESDFNRPAAIIMGSEAHGLSGTWLEGADELIKIPMLGKIDSMNVSASAAIVIFEALRQRNFR